MARNTTQVDPLKLGGSASSRWQPALYMIFFKLKLVLIDAILSFFKVLVSFFHSELFSAFLSFFQVFAFFHFFSPIARLIKSNSSDIELRFRRMNL